MIAAPPAAPPAPPPSHHNPPDDSVVLDVTLACGVLCVGVIVHHLHARLFHHTQMCKRQLQLSSVITDTSALLLLGVVVNAIASAAVGRPLSVARSPQVHDLIDVLLVPPIMLEVGFNIAKLSFLRSLPHALLFGIGGTALSVGLAAAAITAVVGKYSLSEALIFASICASTEPSPILELLPRHLQRLRHVLVGEAALNGSLAIALFAVFRRACRRDAEEGADVQRLDRALAAIARDVLVTLPASVGIGLVAGLLTSLLTLRLSMAKARSPYGPVTLVLAVSFATYNLAERGGFNGDLALFTTGCTVRHYAYHNLGRKARQAAHDLVGTLAYLGDTALALLMGLAVIDYVHKPWAWDAALIGVALPVLLLARALAVLPLAAFARLFGCGRSSTTITSPAAAASRAHGSATAAPPSLSAPQELPLRASSWSVMLLAGVRGSVPFALAISCDDSRAGKAVVTHRETAARLVTSALAVILASNLVLPPLVALLLTCGGKARRARTAEPAVAASVGTSTHGASLLVNDHLRSSTGAIDDLPPPIEDEEEGHGGHTSINGAALGRTRTKSAKKGAGGRLARLIGVVERRVMRPAFGGRVAAGPGGDATRHGQDSPRNGQAELSVEDEESE